MQSLKNESTSQQYEIPATRRPDGSLRKARRVRPGFVPQEEVPLYTPKGKRIAQANANPFPPGWYPDAAKEKPTKPKKQPSSQPSPAADSKKEPQEPQIRIMTKKENTESVKSQALTTAAAVDEISESMQNSLKIREDVIEISKRLKRLRRRLRELEILEDKIKKKEIAKPQKDQLEKISRREDFAKEIEELEKTREELKAQSGMKNFEDDS